MSGPGRNAPCPCGSGKKFKRCCFNRKPLSHVVGVELETPQALKGAQMEPDGTITFLYANEGVRQKRAWVTTYRERKKGQKTLIQADMNPDQLMFGEIHLREYDFVFAIDTNNRRIKGTAVSAAHVMQLRFKSENEVEQTSIGTFVFTDVSRRQENFAWLLLCDEILRSPDHKQDNSYAIVTDSDLGNHPEYNKREKRVYEDRLLPKGFTILYASEEGDGITNQLIRRCDKVSSKTFNEIQSGRFPIKNIPPTSGAPFGQLIKVFNNNPAFEGSGWFQLLRPPT